MTVRIHADDQGDNLCHEGLKERRRSVAGRRETPTRCWQTTRGTWPADLVDDLDEIDREAIRCGRRHGASQRDGEEDADTRCILDDGGLVTGQRTPPSSWWQDPAAKVEQLPKPQYLNNRLDAIKTAFGSSTDEGEKSRMIETSTLDRVNEQRGLRSHWS